MQEILDLSSFERAIKQLENSLSYYYSDNVQRDIGLVMQLRAAAIQAFEFTYELSIKMIRRYLKMIAANPASIDQLSFTDLIRAASDKELLLSDLVKWKRYRQERGTTSHTYNPEKAIEIFDELPGFLKEVRYLLNQLHQRF